MFLAYAVNMNITFYAVEAATTQEDVENGKCDVIDRCDPLKEAKARAKYLLSDVYQKITEMSSSFGYARILKNGELDHGCCWLISLRIRQFMNNLTSASSDGRAPVLVKHTGGPGFESLAEDQFPQVVQWQNSSSNTEKVASPIAASEVNRSVATSLVNAQDTGKMWFDSRPADQSQKVKPFQIRWNEPLGRPECPYMRRWVFNFGLFSVRFHKWIRSDDKSHFHNHPWSFLTIVLRGSYIDVTPVRKDELTAGSMRWRKAGHLHYVDVPVGGALTLLFCGPKVQNWGYWVNGRILRTVKYFHKFGHPPCHEQ